MDSSQIIKRRLAELKKMSVQLKQSTQNNSEVDLNLIYGILEATKSSASKLTRNSQTLPKSSKNLESPLNKLLAMSPPIQPYQTLFPESIQNLSRGNFEVNGKNGTFSANKINQHRSANYQNYLMQSHPFNTTNFNNYDPTQNNEYIGYNMGQNGGNYVDPQTQNEIISLREQNAALQKSLLSLKHQIEQLKQKQRFSKDQEWKQGLPFFKLNQKIQAFYTRLKINESDYNKIDYIEYEAELTLDKLTIKKIVGNTPAKQLELVELLEVHYIDSTIMLLHFGGAITRTDSKEEGNNIGQQIENLFVKFQNEEQLHRWDLALFINFKIVESLKKDKLFNFNTERSRSQSRKHSNQSRYLKQKQTDSNKKSKRSSDHLYQDDQDLMKKLVQRRDLYLQTKKLVSEKMIQKLNQKKVLGNGNKKQAYDDADQYSETHHLQVKDQSMVSRNLFNSILKNEQNDGQTQNQKQQRSGTSKFKEFNNSDQNITVPPLNLSGSNNERGLSFNPGQFDLSLSKKMQEEREKQQKQLKSQKQQKDRKIKQIIRKMTHEGYDLTKYSKDGFNPHQKRVFISEDLKMFCWEQEQGKDKKQIPLSSIKQVQYEKIGEGIRKHIKKPKKSEHCIISYQKDKKNIKVIQLGANSTIMSQFVDELILLIQHLQTE